MNPGGRFDRPLAEAGQEALLGHLRRLPEAARARLERQLERIDWGLVRALRSGEGLAPPPAGSIEPLPCVTVAERAMDPAAAQIGERALREGKVAFALLAGGQASRLRWPGCKGAFPIGPAGDRSLFRILAERILRAGRRYGTIPPLAVTTSPGTDAEVRAHFREHAFFGLDEGRVLFVTQEEIPALDETGGLILEAEDRLFTSPDGHGGAVTALESSGVLATFERWGIEALSTFQVDNPLLRVVDCDFLGRLFRATVPIVTKIVAKRNPTERVGVVVRKNGRPAIVEYSELPPDAAAERDADGRLLWRLGSIGVHAFHLGFLRRELRARLPFHRALRDIPSTDGNGGTRRMLGWKFERFLFDLFPRASSIEVVECIREREFAPLKNAEGPDSPESVRAALEAEYRRWYEEARLPVPKGPLEISPLVAEGPEDLIGS